MTSPRLVPIALDALGEWRMSGRGAFRPVGAGTIESDGGPGILWYPRLELADFLLTVDWCLSAPEDNSGVFVRIPALDGDDPDRAWRLAVAQGYEIQIDDRGVDHDRGIVGSARHLTGAVYGRAPATERASRPPGEWNTFEITASGPAIRVRLNGIAVSSFDGATGRHRGHVGLQAHHPGSRVRFRHLRVSPAGAGHNEPGP